MYMNANYLSIPADPRRRFSTFPCVIFETVTSFSLPAVWVLLCTVSSENKPLRVPVLFHRATSERSACNVPSSLRSCCVNAGVYTSSTFQIAYIDTFIVHNHGLFLDIL
jgi:hypothetical protein